MTSSSAGTAAWAPVTRPSRSRSERKVAEDFNASHPGIHLQFEGFVYAAARDALAVQLGSGNRSRHRRPGGHRRRRGVPRPVARPPAAHRQDRLRHDPVPASRPSTSTTPAARASSASRTRSTRRCCSTRPTCSRRPGSSEPPHEWNGDYTMPDGSTRPWDYDTIREIAKILTVDENGHDATEAGFDPEKIVAVGLRAAARRPAPDRRLLRGRLVHGRRRQDRPDPGAVGRRLEALLRRHLDRPLQHDRPAVRDHRPEPGRLSVLRRQGRDEHQLPVVDVLRR